MNFYDRCRKLRCVYLKSDSKSHVNLSLLSKLYQIAFYSKDCLYDENTFDPTTLDSLPKKVHFSIYCGDINAGVDTLVSTLEEVLSDLGYPKYHVRADSHFYINSCILFTLY